MVGQLGLQLPLMLQQKWANGSSRVRAGAESLVSVLNFGQCIKKKHRNTGSGQDLHMRIDYNDLTVLPHELVVSRGDCPQMTLTIPK